MTGKCHACNSPVCFPLGETDRRWSWLRFTPGRGEVWTYHGEVQDVLWKPMHWCCIPIWEAKFGRNLEQQEAE